MNKRFLLVEEPGEEEEETNNSKFLVSFPVFLFNRYFSVLFVKNNKFLLLNTYRVLKRIMKFCCTKNLGVRYYEVSS